MLCFAVLCLTALTANAGLSVYKSPPEWSSLYSVKGVFYLPLDDLQEPFEAWFDIKNNKTRVDYHGTVARAYVLPPSDTLPKGSFRKIYHITTETGSIELKCDELDLESTKRHPSIENVLPDMADFKLIDIENFLDIKASKWHKVVTGVDRRAEFSVWVKTENGQSIPLKYEVNIYDTLLGTHAVHFYLEYNEYHTKDVDTSAFDKDKDTPCQVNGWIESAINPMDSSLHAVRFAPVEHHFEKFKQIHGRQYASDSEHEARLAIFRKNLKLINEHNRAKSTYKMAVNRLADRTDEELAGLFGGFLSTSDNTRKGLPFPYSEAELQKLSDELPTEFDWRPRGAVTPVKDQQSCGSCWAFSAVGAMEGALFLHHNGSQHVVRLSEQALVDCSWSFGSFGCNGGGSRSGFEWTKKHGLPTYEAYGGYLGENGLCHFENVTSTAFIENWVDVKADDEKALKVAIFKHGPVSVAFYAKVDTLLFYSSGVYYDPKCNTDDINHEVLAVGYGILDGEAYWLIKNSWGTWWGNNGYLLIATKDNICGIMKYPVYVIV